jgi:hypothetical protein
MKLNDRGAQVTSPIKRRLHVLVEFPEPNLEAVIVQWETQRPTVLIQLCRNASEPIQFPGMRPDIPGNAELSKDIPQALDFPLHDFIDPVTSLVFGKEAYNADILFSARAFSILQPEPDLVLPPDPLWECRTEALNSIGVRDAEGTAMARDLN